MATNNNELAAAKKELEEWKASVEKADDVKARLLLEKLHEDEIKKEAQAEMNFLCTDQNKCQHKFNQTMKEIQNDISKLKKGNQDLRDKYETLQAELEFKCIESANLKKKSKILAEMPNTKLHFSGEHNQEDDYNRDQIKGVYTITQRPSWLLEGGQALITFEEEKVASQILKMARCSVSCEKSKVDVRPKGLFLEPSVKFEVHLDVSKKELKFSCAPPSLPEERMKDRLELSFSKPSRGGAEVDSIEYVQDNGTGKVTFLSTGVAEILALRGMYVVDLDVEMKVRVHPVYNYKLRKFQTFCGAPRRTVLLEDILDVEDEEDLQDHLEIHFQKPNNYGGEIESIKYISNGKKLQAFFIEDTVEMEA